MALNCAFITGNAGTGKSYGLKMLNELNPGSVLITSTTGISAINLGCTTVNSVLKYYDTESLQDQWHSGRLVRILDNLFSQNNQLQALAIDEISMMPAEQLQCIYNGMSAMSRSQRVGRDVSLILTGDFAQLPPVQGRFAFEADCWKEFQENTTRLTEVYRQTDPLFLQALDLFRLGQGKDGVELLRQCGVKFNSAVVKYPGTTIVPVNEIADRYNRIHLDELSSPLIREAALRQGEQLGEWKDPKVPDVLELKLGALVMILANDSLSKAYANGDLGELVSWSEDSKTFGVKLFRNGLTVQIGRVTRLNEKRLPGGVSETKVVLGSISYFPLRLAWGSTAHKTQGLTLDRVQIDFRHRFFGNPASMYVALSRVREPKGLRLVGDEKMMVKRCVMHPKVRGFV